MTTHEKHRNAGKRLFDGGRLQIKWWSSCQEILIYTAGLAFTLILSWYRDPFGLF